MSKTAPSSRWFTAWRPSAAPEASDPADLGTAFGLDMSLCEAPAAAPERAAVQPVAAARRLGWMARLASRSKPTA